MKRNSLSPIDILGITLGTIVILLVVVGIIFVARFGPVRGPWFPGRHWAEEFGHDWSEEFSGGGALREEKDQSIAGSFREVEIQNVAGEIRISGGSAGEVQVHSVKTASSARAMQAVQVEIDKQSDRLVIREKREDWPRFRSGSISYTVTLPRGVKSVVAHSVSGSIEVSNIEPGLDQRLETISGSIRTDRAHNLWANSTSGQIDFAFGGQTLEARSISGSVQGDIQSIEKGGSVNISTISGAVSLDAFAGLDAGLNLRSLSGHVSCDFPVTISSQKNNSLEGKIGGGSIPITINSVSGSISIDKR